MQDYESSPRSGYINFEGHENEMESELKLKEISFIKDSGIYFCDSLEKIIFCKNHLTDIHFIESTSISKIAQALKTIGKRFCFVGNQYHRRAMLIQENLISYKPKLIFFEFPKKIKFEKHILWWLVSPEKVGYALQSSSLVPDGNVLFVEDKNAPSRAYQKLWEALYVFTDYFDGWPQKGEQVIDIGAAPGGWTYVMAQLGCEVWSFDRSELDPSLMSMKNVHHQCCDFFKIDPKSIKVEPRWVISDIICYPEDLFKLLIKWRLQFPRSHFIWTIKLQGKIDFNLLAEFQKIPHSIVLHLNANKHEVCFLLRAEK